MDISGWLPKAGYAAAYLVQSSTRRQTGTLSFSIARRVVKTSSMIEMGDQVKISLSANLRIPLSDLLDLFPDFVQELWSEVSAVWPLNRVRLLI